MSLPTIVAQLYKERAGFKRCSELLLPLCPVDRQDIVNPLVRAIVDPFIDSDAREYIFSVVGDRVDMSDMSEMIEECIRIGIPIGDLEENSNAFTAYDINSARLIAQRRQDRCALTEVKEYADQQTVKEFAKRPRWVHRTLPIIPAQVAAEMNKGFASYGVSVRDFLSQFSFTDDKGDAGKTDPSLVEQMVGTLEDVAKVNPEYFRRNGPTNGEKGCGENAVEPHVMFGCKCFEDTPLNRSCDGCGLSIKKIQYCVRMPVQGGGWRGIFCSFGCLRIAPPMVPSEMGAILIEAVESQLNDIGIQDYD